MLVQTFPKHRNLMDILFTSQDVKKKKKKNVYTK